MVGIYILLMPRSTMYVIPTQTWFPAERVSNFWVVLGGHPELPINDGSPNVHQK